MRISVCTPVHSIPQKDFFLNRMKKSLDAQSFKDFEWIITEEGKMAENTNAAIKRAKGDIIKILYMDDYLWSSDALKHIHDAYKKHTGWLASACVHTKDDNSFYNPHSPSYSHNITTGNNTIGSPSVVAFENDDPLLFDEKMTYYLDCDLYARLYERYGEPYLVDMLDVVIGIHEEQVSMVLSDYHKTEELKYITKKYE